MWTIKLIKEEENSYLFGFSTFTNRACDGIARIPKNFDTSKIEIIKESEGSTIHDAKKCALFMMNRMEQGQDLSIPRLIMTH